jgi:hypothetical protein
MAPNLFAQQQFEIAAAFTSAQAEFVGQAADDVLGCLECRLVALSLIN